MKFVKGCIRRSLKYSIIDGLFAAMMVGVSDAYLIPYGIALGASAAQVALLASVPMMLGTILQVHSAKVAQSIGSRTKLINFVVFFHALGWLPIILIPYLFRDRQFSNIVPWVLLAAITLYTSVGAFATAAWQSLMSDFIPVKKRGQYFGWRNRLQGFFTVTVAVLSGLLLNYFGKDRITGFTILFTFAMFCRFISWYCLTQMVEPFRKSSHDIYFSFFAFIRQIRTSNFTKFVVFVSLMSLTVNVSASLFSVFILKDLEFNYASYMVIVTAASLSGFVFQEWWGRAGDKKGHLAILKLAGWGIAVIPILWLFSQQLAYVFFVQIFAGTAWGGFNLLMNNFMMEAVSPEKRIRCISYFNVMNSTATFGGAVIGGVLFHRLPPLFGYSFLTLFLISCVGRVLVMLFFSKRVREVRAA